MLLRRFSSLEKVTHTKVPLQYPKEQPSAPSLQDYETLGVSPSDNNRTIITQFRQLSYPLLPSNDLSVEAQSKYQVLVEAYDRIMLYRMAEQGVPAPVTTIYHPPQTHTKIIKEFLEENAFWTPHVGEHYLRNLFVFWVCYEVLHTLNDLYDPFKTNEVN